MSAALTEVRQLHHQCQQVCVTTTCRSGDCILVVPQSATICIACDRCDCFGQADGEKKPDYVVLHCDDAGTALHWLVIEMKSRPRRPASIAEQLQAGASILERHPRFRIAQKVNGLILVLVKARGIKDTDLAEIRRTRVRFQGNNYPIRVENCGTNLATILPKENRAR